MLLVHAHHLPGGCDPVASTLLSSSPPYVLTPCPPIRGVRVKFHLFVGSNTPHHHQAPPFPRGMPISLWGRFSVNVESEGWCECALWSVRCGVPPHIPPLHPHLVHNFSSPPPASCPRSWHYLSWLLLGISRQRFSPEPPRTGEKARQATAAAPA